MPQVGLWHFRLHYEDCSLNEIVDFMKSRAEVVVIVKEIASRPHIHAVITRFNQTKSTFVQQFLNKFPMFNGNGSYSCSKKNDLEAQIRYCCKGQSKETDPEVLHCIETIDWRVYHEKYWEENLLLKAKSEEVNKGCQNDPSLVLKVKSKTWTEKVYDELHVQFPEHIITIQTFQLLYKPTDKERQVYEDSRKVIFRYVMKAFGKSAKKISNRIIQEIFDGFINGFIQLHGDAGDKYSDKIYNQIYN